MSTSAAGAKHVDGIGTLTYQRALDIARNTEGDLNVSISNYLEDALAIIWTRICTEPTTCLLTKAEFAVFNFFVQRFEGNALAIEAITRYWWTVTSESGDD